MVKTKLENNIRPKLVNKRQDLFHHVASFSSQRTFQHRVILEPKEKQKQMFLKKKRKEIFLFVLPILNRHQKILRTDETKDK